MLQNGVGCRTSSSSGPGAPGAASGTGASGGPATMRGPFAMAEKRGAYLRLLGGATGSHGKTAGVNGPAVSSAADASHHQFRQPKFGQPPLRKPPQPPFGQPPLPKPPPGRLRKAPTGPLRKPPRGVLRKAPRGWLRKAPRGPLRNAPLRNSLALASAS